MIDKPTDEWTEDDWKRLRTAAFELSSEIVEVVTESRDDDDMFSPQVAGYALIIAMGRISGLYGFRSLGVEEVWELWTDAGAKREFCRAFEMEREVERKQVN